MKVLLLDNFDSFTHMLQDYLEQCGADCLVLRNNDPLLDTIGSDMFDALVISPGPETPIKAGKLMDTLEKFIGKKPILGICLGFQAIGLQFGATLQKAKIPRHGKVDEHNHMGNSLFDSVPSKFFATRYHSLILTNLPNNLEAICWSGNEIMGLVHTQLPIWGVQFHPESCETPEGIKMVKNFLNEAKKIAQI
ncbi:MAG: aminodeoxychorismate/anthranilate synthase component II [Bacteroidetes bacterium B1(2017)]|nr:MAG: aminodeoxychorismate/anthranilate synthase component II [Bacteroidetes bacterium B1(2017)]